MSNQHRRPSFGRDSVWLASADVVAVLLAFVGQLILARALLSESYGLFVIAIDLFATLFLLLDLGLPTLLARDTTSTIGYLVRNDAYLSFARDSSSHLRSNHCLHYLDAKRS